MKKLVKYESWKNTKKWADSKRNINATYSMPLFISKTVAAAFFRRARAVGGDRLRLSTHGELRCTVLDLEYKPLKLRFLKTGKNATLSQILTKNIHN